MKKKINLNAWSRKSHFDFFKGFDDPFFGITINVNCKKGYQKSKTNGASFFLSYLHAALRAANDIEEFRYRIEGEAVYLYDEVNASPTIDRGDEPFGFSYMTYYEDIEKFLQEAKKEIDRVRKTKGLVPATSNENVIQFSSLPWLQFTSISHARDFKIRDCIPKISFGKVFEEGEALLMPVSVHASHALMDGKHVARFFELFEKHLNE